jgi:hypothetical protein
VARAIVEASLTVCTYRGNFDGAHRGNSACLIQTLL